MPRSVPRSGLPVFLLIATAGLAGCDSDSFAPERPAGLMTSPATSPGLPSRAKEITLVLPAADNGDLQVYEGVIRTQAGILKAVYRAVRPAPTDPASKQGALITQAAATSSALIVVPDATKETAAALAAVDQKKCPIVLIGRSPASPTTGTPYTLVTFPSFAASAKKIVDAILEDAKKLKLAEPPPVLLVTSAAGDETNAQRDATLTDALKAAKVPILSVVPYSDPALAAQKAVDDAIKAHATVAAVICDDDAGINLASNSRRDLAPTGGKFLIAGYCLPRSNATLITVGLASILVERNVEALARKAIQAAVDRSEGKTVPALVEVELPARRTSTPIFPPGVEKLTPGSH